MLGAPSDDSAIQLRTFPTTLAHFYARYIAVSSFIVARSSVLFSFSYTQNEAKIEP